MNALHRLADPLTGHDSMQALDPEARKRRQENVQRVRTGDIEILYCRRGCGMDAII